MVNGAEARARRRNILRQFSGSRAELSRQAQSARQRLSSERERLEAEQRITEQQRQAIQSAQGIRSIPVTQRQQIAGRIASRQQQILGGISAIASARQQLEGQVETIAGSISRAEREFREGGQDLTRLQAESIIASQSIPTQRIIEFEEARLGQSLPRDIRQQILEAQFTPVSIQDLAQAIQFQQPQVRAIQLPSVGERFRGIIREQAGISLPSIQQTFNILTGEPEFTRITPRRIIEAPKDILIAGAEAFGSGVRLVAQETGFEGIPIATQPSEVFPTSLQPLTLGERIRAIIREESGISLPSIQQTFGRLGGEPEFETRTLTPRQLQFLATTGAEIGAISILPAVGSIAVGMGFVSSGVERALDPQLSLEQRIFGGAEAGLGAILFAAPVTRFLTTPRTIFRQGVQQPTVKSLGDNIVITNPQTGEQIVFARAGSTGFIPARFEQRVSRIRELAGDFPPPTQISPRTTFSSSGKAILNEAGQVVGIVDTTRQTIIPIGERFGITGSVEEIPFNLNQLTPLERRILTEGINRGNPLITTPSNSRFFRSSAEFQKLFRSTGGLKISGDRFVLQRTFIPPRPGRRLTSIEGISEVVPLARTPTEELFGFRAGAADITRTLAPRRFTREVGVTRVRQGRLPDLEFVPEGLITEGAQAQLQQTALQRARSLAFQKQAEQQFTQLAIQRARQTARVIVRPAVTPTTTPPISGVVSAGVLETAEATKLAPSQFAGKGLFERTEQIDSIINKAEQRLSLDQPLIGGVTTTTRLSETTIPGLSSKELLSIKQVTDQILELQNKQRQRNISLTGFAQPLVQNVRTRQKQIEKTIIRTRLISKSIQEQAQKQIQVTTTPTRKPPISPPITKPPVVPPVALPITKDTIRLRSALKKLRGRALDVIIKRKKKEVIIAKGLPPNKAVKTGKEFVAKNIAASFKVRDTGKTTKKKDIPPVKIGNQFRLSKKDPLFIVEKRKFRLDSPGEKAQIKAAKRRKKK